MSFDPLNESDKRRLHQMADSYSEILDEVKQAVNQSSKIWRSPSAPMKQTKAQVIKKRQKNLPRGGKFLQVLGIILAALNGSVLFAGMITVLSSHSGGNSVPPIVLFSLLTIGGIILAVYGHKRNLTCQRYQAYINAIGNQDAVSIHSIADGLNMDYHQVTDDFGKMILSGILSPAWLDLKHYRLMLTEPTDERPAEAQAEAPKETHEENPANRKEECLSRSELILRKIRADNDLIADEEVSAKIDRIEDLTRKIFAILDKYPEKEKELYSFLNYYLPTTLKTLESYARLEAQGVETQTIHETKQKINGVLDELCSGYEKQLDRLFEHDAVDITADIEVMRKMLQRDGLAEDEFTKK